MVVMTKKILNVLILLVVSSFVESEDQKLEDQKQSDYFAFDLVWPNSYCNSKIIQCKEPIPQEFKVMGLSKYKSNKLRRQPAYTGPRFNTKEVENWNFSRSLALVWPDLGQRGEINNERTWRLAWCRHGSGTGMKPENYFYLAVKYAEQYKNIYRDLLHSGVVIPSNRTYQREVLHRVIAEVVGSSPTISCNTYERKKLWRNESKRQFLSIRICMNINSIAFDCPDKFNKCGYSKSYVLFPTSEMISFSRNS